jgi:hypothetical protein
MCIFPLPTFMTFRVMLNLKRLGQAVAQWVELVGPEEKLNGLLSHSFYLHDK